MTQPILSTSLKVPQTTAQEVFGTPDLTSLIFQKTQERNISLINKASRIGSLAITANSWGRIQQALTREALQKRHPTLVSFIRSNQITNHQQLVAHLRKEAQDLGLTQTYEFQAFRTSTASKFILSLDALIEQTNFERANRDNRLWNLLEGVELPVIRNYVAWNEAIQVIDVRAITALNLANCNLTRIPHGVFQLQNLRCLYLQKNQLAALPQEIGQLQNLQGLDLNDNKLAALPPEIEQLRNLQRLYLSYNQLAALPPQIGQLQNLLNLDLDNNQLTALPLGIGQLQNLLDLDLDNNRLTALPLGIGQLQNLEWIRLKGNQLADLPESFSALAGRLGNSNVQKLILKGRVKRCASLTGLLKAIVSTAYAGIVLVKNKTF